MLPLRNRHFLLSDLVLIPVAAYCSFVLRLEEFVFPRYWSGYLLFTLVALLVVPLCFQFGGVYRRYWRYASVNEVILLILTVTLATILAGVLSLGIDYVVPHTTIPRSIPVIFLLLALVVTLGPRLVVRGYATRRRRNTRATPGRPVLVVGAGQAGGLMVREIQRNTHLDMEVVGLLDDDRGKRGMQIHGVRVLGDRNDIPTLVPQYNVELVIIAIPTASGKVIRELTTICERASVAIKVMPGVYELLGGRVSVSQLRDVQIEDLLRRSPVQTETAAVAALVQGKRVLITGGGGSIGSELCRQLLRYDPAELIILGHGENSVFEIHNELCMMMGRQAASRAADGETTTPRRQPCRLTTTIADIRFNAQIRAVFEHYRPEIVFHAAAHKHVPLMELNPGEAITNNVLGTRNVIDAALATGVDNFVMISSDKAVNPTNIMGATKRTGEFLVHEAATRSGMRYVAVRFGNVLGSRGSVVHTFRKQIAAGGPVTLTDPRITRYFMTIPEAVTLVLQAAAIGDGGEVFMLDMGQPVKIADLAEDMIRLSGLEVGQDIEIISTGLRPGEKLYEELFIAGETYKPTQHAKIFIASNASTFVPEQLDHLVDSLVAHGQNNDREAIVRGLQVLVPEFRPQLQVERPGSAQQAKARAASQSDAHGAETGSRMPITRLYQGSGKLH